MNRRHSGFNWLLPVLILLVSSLAPAQRTLRIWTGTDNNRFGDSTNWVPVGTPATGDSLVIPNTSRDPEMVDARAVDVGALHVQAGAKLALKLQTALTFSGPIIVDSGGTLSLTVNLNATVHEMRIFGTFTVSNGRSPAFLCRGNLIVGPGATFDPQNASFDFSNPLADFLLPPITFYDLVIDSCASMTTNGNVEVENLLQVNFPLSMRPQDTLTLLNGSPLAITGQAEIRSGTIVRTIKQSIAEGGGKYRFDNPETAVTFFNGGTLPTRITMTSHPGEYPNNLDTTLVVKRYYDIHQVGGNGFRLNLTLQADSDEANALSGGGPFAIYRSTNDGTTWMQLPATSFDTSLRTIAYDNVTGFSRYGFGRIQAVTSIEPVLTSIPIGFMLHQNYPNPFNPVTVIEYDLPAQSHVTLSISDVLGRTVATLVDGEHPAGHHSVRWDASLYPSGVYFSRLTAGNVTVARKILLTR